MIPARREATRLRNLRGIMHYPVHRPNWLTVTGTVLSGVVDAIVITVVLGRTSRAKKRVLGKDGLTGLIVSAWIRRF
jgi:hypothetical protein